MADTELQVRITLSRGEIGLLERTFHDNSDQLILAESLIPKIQAAMTEAIERQRRQREMAEKVADASEDIGALFGPAPEPLPVDANRLQNPSAIVPSAWKLK